VKVDKLIRSRRKTFELAVLEDGSLVVRAPLRASKKQIEELVTGKEAWIRRQQERAAQFRRSQPPHYSEGSEFLFLGQPHLLHLVEGSGPPRLDLSNGCFQLPAAALPQAARCFEAWYRGQARQILPARVAYLAAQHAIPLPKVRISGARSRWGSCGVKRGLNFSWRLVQAPLEVIDYVVAHELAHLAERNHSSRFWARVAELMPGFQTQRAWLKANGARLNLRD
jgi:predicted metal-dependent hydrolase